MDQDETIKRFKEGKERWNEWAEGMLAERKRLEEAGEWAVTQLEFGEGALNAATDAWIDAASADFNSSRGKLGSDFSELVFPGNVMFQGNSLPEKCNFSGATFKGAALFAAAVFRGGTKFRNATFLKG